MGGAGVLLAGWMRPSLYKDSCSVGRVYNSLSESSLKSISSLACSSSKRPPSIENSLFSVSSTGLRADSSKIGSSLAYTRFDITFTN